jgi:hypothetical protein
MYVLKGHSAPDFAYKFKTISYAGEDCCKHLINTLEANQEEIVRALKKYYFEKYDKKLKILCNENCKCTCAPTEGNEKTRFPNGLKSYQPHKAPKEVHHPNCKFVKIRGLLLRKEWAQIPIYGYGSGKYDLTFLIPHMLNPKFPVANLITRNNSYLKLSYGSFDFLDAHNLVPMNINLNQFAEMWGVKNKKEINAYDWLDDKSKLDEKEFPAIEHFYNSLKGEECPIADYNRALEIYKEKKFKNFGEWLMHYCERDVDLLIEGLNGFRELYLETAKMDICNYISIPQIANANALKNFIKLPLYQLESEQIFDVINPSIYGGNCQVFERHAKVGELDSNGNEITLIFSIDENNLYGHSLLRPLPYGKFTFCDDPYQCDVLLAVLNSVSREQHQLEYEKRYSTQYLHSKPTVEQGMPKQNYIDPYAMTGFISCSLYYTQAQKERLKDFPPLPSRIAPDSFMRSDYMKDIKAGFDLKDSKSEKLVYSLCPQPVYYIYSEMLKYLLENDMITLEKIHKFVYTPLGYVYHDFIQAMTKLRQQAEDMKQQAEQDAKSGKISNEEKEERIQMANSLKEFAKLNNNSCYGKTIQSDEKFDTSVMVNSKEKYLNQTIGRGLMDFNILAPKADNHNGFVELKLKKDKYEIKSNKGDGAAVLSISKMLMLDFIYNGPISKAYTKDEVKYMYTDTDGLVVRVVQLPDARAAPRTYEEFLQRFDETPECRLLRDRHFAKPGELTPGKMKFETSIVEFVALSPKVYAFDTGADELDAKGKIERRVTKMKGVSEKQNKHLEFNKYLEAYHKGIRVKATNTMILKTNKHSKMEMVTVEQNKWALTPYDDKRLWINKNVSIPWGYSDIEYNPARVFARIIRNCARRVNISIKKFLSILG